MNGILNLTDNEPQHELKLVRDAEIFRQGGVIFLRHYKTIIFAYNIESGLCEINWHCSKTSDNQIRRAIDFFNIAKENILDVSDGVNKWRYSTK